MIDSLIQAISCFVLHYTERILAEKHQTKAIWVKSEKKKKKNLLNE